MNPGLLRRYRLKKGFMLPAGKTNAENEKYQDETDPYPTNHGFNFFYCKIIDSLINYFLHKIKVPPGKTRRDFKKQVKKY
jgi:hypothetical protein